MAEKKSTTIDKAALLAEHPEYSARVTKFKAYTGKEPYLFISYSHRDTEKVYETLDDLYDKRFRIWYDESCETGNDFRDELRKRIEKCEAVILFISEASMTSPFCGMEIIVARENNKRIFPVFVDDNVQVPPAFQILLSNTHHGSISNRTNRKKLIEDLHRDLPATAMDRLTFDETRTTLEKCENNGESIVVAEDKENENVRIIAKGAFNGRDRLKRIVLPESLEIIEDEGFRACSSLEEIDIPHNTISIGNSAFRDCLSLKNLNITNGLIKIRERAFENCPSLIQINLPEDLSELYGSVFNGCKSLVSIKLPENLTVIGETAFADCVSLEKVDLPDSVLKIDDLVFSGCTSLNHVSFPNGIKKIGKAAFKNCTSLKKVELPASLTYISPDAFRGCSSLTSIKIDPKNRYYKSAPFKDNGSEHVLFNKSKSVIVAYPASSNLIQYDIPDSVTDISDWTFSECKKLTRITIPDSVESIGEGAFCNCSHIDELIIPDTVTLIDDCAFRGCASLEKILIPSSVAELGWGIFDGCPENMVVYCDEGSEIQAYCLRNKIKEDRISAWENN